LLWYTADEPDGTSDPFGATVTSSNLITSLDGGDGNGGAGYHPVSLVLNCQNYYFTYVIYLHTLVGDLNLSLLRQYASGADVLMQDVYMIGNNVTWSTVWGTPCTEDFGVCGYVSPDVDDVVSPKLFKLRQLSRVLPGYFHKDG
jgi:hypothetical protein